MKVRIIIEENNQTYPNEFASYEEAIVFLRGKTVPSNTNKETLVEETDVFVEGIPDTPETRTYQS